MTTIVGSSGNDNLGPGPGSANDSIVGLAGNDTLFGGAGNDTLDGGADNDQLFGGADADSLVGGSGNDTISGGTGNDTVEGGAGNDSLVGGGGTDLLSYASAAGPVSVNLTSGLATGEGTDTLSGFENLAGSAFADTLIAEGGANVVFGGAGADRAYGREGNDSVLGGDGNDTIFGGTGADSLLGDPGDDRIYGGTSSDSLFGGLGHDELFGGDDADLLFGGDGNDTLFGGAGNDTLSGGTGFDYAAFSGATANVTVSLVTNTATGEGTDSLVDIEGVLGGFGNDSIVGNAAANHLVGGAGNDTISAGGGNDTVEGGLGNDSLSGGDGIDELSFRGATLGVNANLSTGLATGEGSDSFSGFENLTGSFFDDTLTGDDSANVIRGGDGNDIVNAAGGNDTVFGGAGNDTVDGGAGNDLIFGGAETGTTGSGAPIALDFNWNLLGNQVALPGSVSQDTGGITVNVQYVAGPSGTAGRSEADVSIFVAGGEPFNSLSSARIERVGVSDEPSEITIDFAANPGSNLDNEVRNVRFRISDVDEGAHQDRLVIIAYDAQGNRVPVTFTHPSDLQSFGDTVQSSDSAGGTNPAAADGSVLVTIAGPVARIEIQYDNLGSDFQLISISDLHFQAVPLVDNDLLSGGIGDDTIFGGIGLDTLSGGLGNDSLLGGEGADSLSGDDGNDTLDGGAGNDTILGGIGNDSIEGGSGDDTILFGAGDDTVFGGSGNDLIDDAGGIQLAGTNLLYGGAGNDTIWAGDGADSLFGDQGNDVLYGESGNDTIVGGTGNDSMFGGAGNDVFIVGLGDQTSTVPGSESVDGGGTLGAPVSVDFDVLDLTAYGWSRVDIVWNAGDPGTEAGHVLLLDALGNPIGRIDFTEIESIIPCFTPGTMILTDRGEVAVESLLPGDLVMTRDHGLQPLRWTGRRRLTLRQLVADPDLQPVRIARGALGGQGPDRTMLVSPQHRVLVTAARAELLFGEAEVLVPAKHLVGQAEVTRALPEDGLTYIHLLFDRHELLQSDGIWTESFQPAERMLTAMEAAARAEVLALFPELAPGGEAFTGARLSLKAHEARVLFAAA